MNKSQQPKASSQKLEGKKVLIWGVGSHGGGLAAAKFCHARGAKVSLLDAKPSEKLPEASAVAQKHGWAWCVGNADHPSFAAADLIVASPAIPPRAWPKQHPPVISPEGLFFSEHRGRRIAVTGTKGKSTTAMIAGTLLQWPVGGNSNEPLLDLLDRLGPETPVVCELSSFQLWYLRDQQPRFDAVILTSLSTDHLDWHPDVAHYHEAKLRLLNWSDALVIGENAPTKQRSLPLVRRDGNALIAPDGSTIAERSDLPLRGDHNVDNARLALTAAFALGLAPSTVRERLRSVRGLPHRLQDVHLAAGIDFVDDSIATTPESAIAALSAIEGPLAVILGGSDKGATWTELATAVKRRRAVPILIGQTAPAIHAALSREGVQATIAASIDEAVRRAIGAMNGRGTVLLSPACASFDMFRGFEHRGDCFAACARALSAAKSG